MAAPDIMLALFNPAEPEPRRVLGWYHTGLADYPALPSGDRVLELTQAEWDNRMATPWIAGGRLTAAGPVEPDAPTPGPSLHDRVAALEAEIAALRAAKPKEAP